MTLLTFLDALMPCISIVLLDPDTAEIVARYNDRNEVAYGFLRLIVDTIDLISDEKIVIWIKGASNV